MADLSSMILQDDDQKHCAYPIILLTVQSQALVDPTHELANLKHKQARRLACELSMPVMQAQTIVRPNNYKLRRLQNPVTEGWCQGDTT